MQKEGPKGKEDIQEDHQCPICLDVFDKPISLNTCKHLFCDSCLNEAAMVSNNYKCPFCRTLFTHEDIHPQIELWNLIQKKYPQALKTKKLQTSQRTLVKFIIGNTTQQLDTEYKNKYRWKLFVKSIEGQQPLHKVASLVQVELDQTFQPPVVKFKPKEDQPITLTRLGWGTFILGIKVHWKNHFNQKSTEFFHNLQFVAKTEKIVHVFLTPKKKK